MNTNEARLAIVEEIAAILLDLTDDPDNTSPEEREALSVAMLDAADIVAEALDLEVVEVVEGVATVTLNIAGDDAVLAK
jgi:hypothetical protein